MRLPTLRFNIRTFMVTLALATTLVVLGVPVVTWFRHREDYFYGAEYHDEKEQAQRQILRNHDSLKSRGLDKDPLFPIVDDLARRRLAFHAEMKRKWRKAAANPWAEHPDDPAEPTDDRIVKPFDLPPLQKIDPESVRYLDPSNPEKTFEPSQPEK